MSTRERFRGAWEGGKEWFHFCLDSERGPLLVNLLAEERRGRVEGVATVLALGPEPFAVQERTTDLRLERGGARARIGRCELRLGPSAHVLSVELPGAIVHAELAPRCPPTTPSSTRYPGGTLHWSVLPDCALRGTAVLDGRESRLGPWAYHDHNWGDFEWGPEVAWEWAYARAEDVVVVWMRMASRRTRRELGRALLAWRGARSAGAWTGPEVEVAHEGAWSRPAALTTPAPLRHVLPDRVSGIPERLVVRGGSPRVEVSWSARSVARLLVPDDAPTGTGVIHEIDCDAAIALDGASPLAASSAVLEIVRGA